MFQNKQVLALAITLLNIELLVLILFCGAAVNAQQSQLITDNYIMVSGYDVSNYSAPISSISIAIPALATASCIYACEIITTCTFAVLKANLTCNTYSSAAKTSVYASANSTFFKRQINGSFLDVTMGLAYRPLTGYVILNSISTNSISLFACSDPVVCINSCSFNATCGLAVYQNISQTCQLTSANYTGQILVGSSNGTVYQKLLNGLFPSLPMINSAGYALSITNYWPITNGSYADCVGGRDLSVIGSVTQGNDRLNNLQASFQTSPNNYAQAPAGLYFTTGSFSITMWIQSSVNNAYQTPLFEFSNGASSDNVHFDANIYGEGCASGAYFQIFSGSSDSKVCTIFAFTVGMWYHISVTYNVTSLTGKIYVNGVLTGAGTLNQIQNLTRSQNYFGKNVWAVNQFGNLMFDEIKFHGRVLSAAEVLGDYAYNKSYIAFV